VTDKKNIFVIIGSASNNSANEKLIDYISGLTVDFFTLTVFKDLKTLPHFDPELSTDDPPTSIIDLREKIDHADGVIICTPEYIFSIPSGLKNALEWCVATTIFTEKPTGLITASASGQQGHEELKLIMKTVMANFTDQTTLHIQGIKGKIDQQGQLIDPKTIDSLTNFINAFKTIVFEK
jgi:NAD(P)H-dependent FMN reductase